jgi:hypothetical protein
MLDDSQITGMPEIIIRIFFRDYGRCWTEWMRRAGRCSYAAIATVEPSGRWKEPVFSLTAIEGTLQQNGESHSFKQRVSLVLESRMKQG